jgi:hypothetical protein
VIGGTDIIFPVWSGATALDFCVRLVSQWWPKCVFAVDEDPAIYTRYSQFGSASEVIVYRDQAACDAWDELGYDESLRGTMVYLISEPERLTVVVEHDPSPEIAALIEAIRAGLPTAFPVWPAPAPLEAA